MSLALVRVYPGRPPWIRHEGGWVCLSILDARYLNERSAWRHRLKMGNRYADTVAGYRRWQREQDALYAGYGLAPPIGALTAGSRGRYRRKGDPRLPTVRDVRIRGKRFGRLSRHEQVKLFRQFADWLASRAAHDDNAFSRI